MKNQKRFVFILALVLIAGTASAVTWIKSHKRLGKPAVKATPIAGIVVDIDLPERVLEFTATATNLPQDETTLGYLPKDTSFGRRRYAAPDGFEVEANIILMGADRTSIHKADYCLAGAGLHVDAKETATIAVGGQHPYQLPVAKWAVSGEFQEPGGQKRREHGLYVFWFVADGEITPSYSQYKLWLMWDMLRTFTLQRWAYVSFFARCAPGQQDAVFERMAKLIAASVPEFQLPPSSAVASAAPEP